jgi:hypothetical protein
MKVGDKKRGEFFFQILKKLKFNSSIIKDEIFY